MGLENARIARTGKDLCGSIKPEIKYGIGIVKNLLRAVYQSQF